MTQRSVSPQHSPHHLGPGKRALWLSLKTAAALALLIPCFYTIDPLLTERSASLDPAVRDFFRFITRFGQSDWIFILTGLGLVALFVMLRRNPPRPLAVTARHLADAILYPLLAVAGSGIIVQVIKAVVGRARPKFFETLGPHHFEPFHFSAGFASFPSGHTATIFALATVIATINRSLTIPAFFIAGLIGVSRIVTRAHYFSDMMGGIIIGVVFTLALRQLMAERRRLFLIDPAGAILLRGSTPLRRFPTRLAAHLRSRDA